MTLDRFYLLFSGIGLSTIGMSYGISPANVLPAVLEITVHVKGSRTPAVARW
jgi:hypothetical protein